MFTDWRHPAEIPPVRVLRMELRGPVTLGHVLLLDELGSPVVRGEGIGIGDLYTAALVCSGTAQDARADIKSRWLPILTRLHGYRCGRLDFEKETETFCEWFTAQCGGPRALDPLEKSRAPRRPQSAPWYIAKLAMAVGELGMSVPDAEAMPVKRLNQLVAALAEARGNANFETEEGHSFIEQVQEWERERLGKAF